MSIKIVVPTMMFFLLLSNNVCAQSGQTDYADYKEIIKQGPIPDAILTPPVEKDFARANTLLAKIFGSDAITRIKAETKACYSNQRNVAGAIEKYNMDNGHTYHTLNHADVTDSNGLPVAAKCMTPHKHLSPARHLRNYGDLSGYNIIYCDYHGTLPEYRDGLRAATGDTSKSE